MRTLHTLQCAGPDKTLRVSIPVDEAGRPYQVIIVIAPQDETAVPSALPASSWPPGYFESTPGSITDTTFVRPPQGDYEQRAELE